MEREAVLKHIEFCIVLCKSRVDKGKRVLFEHPALADSWQEPVMTKFAKIPGVESTSLHVWAEDEGTSGRARYDGEEANAFHVERMVHRRRVVHRL